MAVGIHHIYHRFEESSRYSRRVHKVTQIEGGNVDEVFEGIDHNEDGKISREELYEYLVMEGLDSEIFLKAYDELDMQDGVRDGEVNLNDLMAHFEALVTAIAENKDSVFNMETDSTRNLRHSLRGSHRPTEQEYDLRSHWYRLPKLYEPPKPTATADTGQYVSFDVLGTVQE